MKKPFDIKYRPQIESGEYKVQEKNSGRSVRIICWDATTGTWPVIALIEDYGIPKRYTVEGHCYMHNDDDLVVITTESELTEFEKHVQAVMMNSGLVGCTECYKDIDTVKTTAKSLLEYAKAELQPKYDATKVDETLIDGMMMIWRKRKLDNDVSFDCHEVEAYRQGLTDMYKQFAEELEKAFKYQDDVVYNDGYHKGFKHLFDSIPHWKNSSVSKCSQPTITNQNVLFYKGYFIHIDELLKKLPKDE